MQLPPPHCLKAVELGIIDPEVVVPREWLYDFCILCPATPEDCVAFFRHHGATAEVDDNTYIALVAGGFFRRALNTSAVARVLEKRFRKNARIDEGLRRCIDQLAYEQNDSDRARDICTQVFTPYQELADRLLSDLPADDFSCWR